MDKIMVRQGDVALIRVAKRRRKLTAVPRSNGRLVLAFGEVTGHAHVLDAPPAEAALLTDSEGQRFLRLVTAAPLVHEEHGTIQIAPGEYRVVIGREWSTEMGARPVVD